MEEKQNWGLMGAIYKEQAEALREERKVILQAVGDLKEALQAVLLNSEITQSEFNAINTLLELAK